MKNVKNTKQVASKLGTVPKKAFVDMTAAEKKNLPVIKYLMWKDEGDFGPLYVVFNKLEKTVIGADYVTVNYKDSDLVSHFGGLYAEWYTKSEAKAIAANMNVQFCEA